VEYVGDEAGLTRLTKPRTWVEAKLNERILARKVGEFEWADSIFQELEAHGIVVMDRTVHRNGTPEGVEWVVRNGTQHRGLRRKQSLGR
jgi:cysteinyl-tRNA synthetase